MLLSISKCCHRSYSFRRLEEEGTQDGGRHDEEDAGTEPRGGGLRGVRIPGRELRIDFHSPDKPHHGTDGVDEFRGGIEVRGHHVRGLVDARKTVALCKGGSGSKKQYCREK